jgi:O-antigen/teichoic acid export membrane protein
VKSLALDAITAGAGVMGAAGLSLAIAVLTARWLGVEEFGLYNFGFAYVALWAVFMDGGATMLAPREVARGRGREALAALLALKPPLVIVTLAALLAVAALAGFEPHLLALVLVLAVGSAIDSCFGLLVGGLRGRREFAMDAGHQLGQRLLFGLLAAAALAAGRGALGVAGARAVSLAAATVSAFGIVRAREGFPRVDATTFRAGMALLRTAAGSLLIVDLMTQLHTRGPQLVLRFTRDLAEVGLYAAPARLIDGLTLLPTAFGIVLLPRLVATAKEGVGDGGGDLRSTLRALGVIGAAIAVVGALAADELTRLLFGAQYMGSAAVLRILLVAFVLAMLNAVIRAGLIAAGRERAYAVMLTMTAAANITLNLALTPAWGARGAAAAVLVSETLLLVLAGRALRSA